VLDIFQKPNLSKDFGSKLFQRFFGVSQVAAVNGAVSLNNLVFLYIY
jgi:hypothetical protein